MNATCAISARDMQGDAAFEKVFRFVGEIRDALAIRECEAVAR
jgi:hypothetical protein